jgi:hypothetical protein
LGAKTSGVPHIEESFLSEEDIEELHRLSKEAAEEEAERKRRLTEPYYNNWRPFESTDPETNRLMI